MFQSVVVTLGRAIPSEGQPWFHATLDRQQAEQCLSRLDDDGVFLVRRSSNTPGALTISFRCAVISYLCNHSPCF